MGRVASGASPNLTGSPATGLKVAPEGGSDARVATAGLEVRTRTGRCGRTRARAGRGRGEDRCGRGVPLRPAPDARLRGRGAALAPAVHTGPRERRVGAPTRPRRHRP